MEVLKLFTAATAFSFMLFAGCKEETDGPVSPGIVVPTPCNGETPLLLWVKQQTATWSPEAIAVATQDTAINMLSLTIAHATYYENSAANQYYGLKGEYTHQLEESFNELKRFWDIRSENIVMVAKHGSMLQDRGKVLKTYKTVYGYSDDQANHYADLVVNSLKKYPEYLNGNHPVFAYDANAIQGKNELGIGPYPDKIVMGDGLLQALSEIGYGDIAPQAILAHEFGHHIQMNLGIIDDSKPTPERNRRRELMADAYAAYFLSHARGAALPWKSVQRVSDVFSNLGDCNFESALHHHGTPTQRKAAIDWGFELAKDASHEGHILPSKEFAKRFDAALANIVKK